MNILHPFALAATAALATAANAQGRHVFDLDPANSSFTFTGTVAVPVPGVGTVTGNLFGTPATVDLDGSVAADVTVTGGQITQARLVSDGTAAVDVPPLVADVVFPGVGNIATATGSNLAFEFVSVDASGTPTPFAVAVDGSFATFLSLRGTSGTLNVSGTSINTTIDFDGAVGAPRPVTGTISPATNAIELSSAIDAAFDESGPNITATLTLFGAFESEDRALAADIDSVDIVLGGTQRLRLSAGTARAGAPYLVLSTSAGTDPGVTVGGVTLPLNADGSLLRASLLGANGPIWMDTAGMLGPIGTADATIQWPALPFPALAGLVDVHHAYLTFDSGGPASASNAQLLSLD